MCDVSIILNKVTEFVSKEKLFTSVDIANAIKKSKTWVRNREVASWLRTNMETMFDHYAKHQLRVANGKSATLYYPANKNPSDYDTADLSAISPKEFDAIMSDGTAVKPTAQVQSAVGTRSKSTILAMQATRPRLCNAQDRIRIPAPIVKVMKLKAGQEIEVEARTATGRVMTTLANHKVKIMNDGRINLPKRFFTLAMPVKILADNDKVILQEV